MLGLCPRQHGVVGGPLKGTTLLGAPALLDGLEEGVPGDGLELPAAEVLGDSLGDGALRGGRGPRMFLGCLSISHMPAAAHM